MGVYRLDGVTGARLPCMLCGEIGESAVMSNYEHPAVKAAKLPGDLAGTVVCLRCVGRAFAEAVRWHRIRLTFGERP